MTFRDVHATAAPSLHMVVLKGTFQTGHSQQWESTGIAKIRACADAMHEGAYLAGTGWQPSR